MTSRHPCLAVVGDLSDAGSLEHQRNTAYAEMTLGSKKQSH